MKVIIDRDEKRPAYSLEGFKGLGEATEVPDELFQRYQSVLKEYLDIQRKIGLQEKSAIFSVEKGLPLV